jgi:putative ABC transport system permease protein
VGRALAMFNRESLMEIDLLYDENMRSEEIAKIVKKRLIARHGHEDFTVTSQEQMLEVLGSIMQILTFGVAAIGSISLFVGGVGILTIMTIGVRERTGEIGLLRALGATKTQILLLFLTEALILGACGGICGLVLGGGGAWLLSAIVPALPTHTSLFYALAAELLAILIGLGAGILPARRAASLDPIEALRAE